MKKLSALLFSILTITLLVAQTGPGGVGNSSNNVIWLDGDVVNLASSNIISSWPDQSGNGNDFNQGTSSKQPKRVIYYGHDGVRFDGGDFLRRGAVAALNTNTNTQYIVYNGFRSNHVGILYEGSFTQSSQFFRTYRSNGNLKSWVLNSTNGVVQNTTTNSSAFQILSSVWDGGAQSYTTFKDGVQIGSQTGANGNPTGNFRNTIGAASNNSYRFNGDMGEVIIYNSALNSAQRNIVDNYLSSKFKITIANDMYAYDTGLNHKYDVVGVGQEADGNNLVAQGRGIVEMTASAGLSNGDYIIFGHDDENLANVTNDVPALLSGGFRTTRTWRTGVTGSPGTVDINFDVSSLPLLPGSYYLLVESNNGVFNDGGVVTYGPFVDVGGIVTFTGVALADGDYFTIGSDNGAAITSKKTGFWDVGSTWNCNCVPGATDDATVLAGHTVSARTTTNINDLIVEGNLNTQSTGAFNVTGNYTISATGTATHKVITFNGTSQQDITNNSATTVDFFTLTVNNANNVTLQNGDFSVSNSLNTKNGQLQNVGGVFTFLSTASSTAVIIDGSGGFSGNFILQRHVSTRNANWGDLSSPVAAATLGEWDSNPTNTVTELFMSEVGGIDGSAAGFNSVYRFNPLFQTFAAVTDTTFSLVPGLGLEIWIGDDFNTWNAKTFDSRGTPNFGDLFVPVSNSFNLVGNPYQAWISWANLTKPTLNPTYYIYNTNTGNYDAKTTGNIPPHQGFWVESVGSGTLTISESAKTGSGSSNFFRTDMGEFTFPGIDNQEIMDASEEPFDFNEVKLKVSSSINSYSHELKLRLNTMATIDDDIFDAKFLKSRLTDAPSITTFANNSNKELAINSFNYQDEVVMPIKIKVGVTGDYIIDPISFENISSDYKYMELKDKVTGKVYDLTEYNNQGIKVEIDENDNSERFSLRLSNSTPQLIADQNVGVNIYKSFNNTVIEFSNIDINYEIIVYNALGQIIIETSINGEDRLELDNSKMASGINIISVKSTDGVVTKKINY